MPAGQTPHSSGRRVAVQEYGTSNVDLLAGLEARGARVTAVPVYQWALPEDLGPLEDACRALATKQVDVALFTTATQVVHLLQVAERMGAADSVRAALGRGGDRVDRADHLGRAARPRHRRRHGALAP